MHASQRRQITAWARSWTPGKPHALIIGPTGCGKTFSVESDAIINRNPIRVDVTRPAAQVLAELERGLSSRDVSAYLSGKLSKSKPSAIVIDGLESFLQTSKALSDLRSFMKKSVAPIVMLASATSNSAIKDLSEACTTVRWTRPTVQETQAIILKRAGEVKIVITKEQAMSLAVSCGCDLRQSIQQLEFVYGRSTDGSVALMSSIRSEAGMGTICDRPMAPFDVAGMLMIPSTIPAPMCVTPLALADKHKTEHLVPILIAENYVRAAPSSSSDPIGYCVSMSDLASQFDERCCGGPEVVGFGAAVEARKFGVTKFTSRPEFPSAGGCYRPCKARTVRMSGRIVATEMADLIMRIAEPMDPQNAAESMLGVGLDAEGWSFISKLNPLAPVKPVPKTTLKSSASKQPAVKWTDVVAKKMKDLTQDKDCNPREAKRVKQSGIKVTRMLMEEVVDDKNQAGDEIFWS